ANYQRAALLVYGPVAENLSEYLMNHCTTMEQTFSPLYSAVNARFVCLPSIDRKRKRRQFERLQPPYESGPRDAGLGRQSSRKSRHSRRRVQL
ncbi:hypothetical protein, partial [Paraburkholderia graminis]|uniref:hypothetical protein n=1 Tax=Paraburkholderia graminis TaxID=60548 RepID=UPI0038BB507A